MKDLKLLKTSFLKDFGIEGQSDMLQASMYQVLSLCLVELNKQPHNQVRISKELLEGKQQRITTELFGVSSFTSRVFDIYWSNDLEYAVNAIKEQLNFLNLTGYKKYQKGICISLYDFVYAYLEVEYGLSFVFEPI